MTDKKIVFSAVQPTGAMHLGNYLGALKNFVALQKDYQCIFCVADLHALTQWESFAEKGFSTLTQDSYYTLAVFIACGIDPKKHILFNQSRVPAHAELAWFLTCVARFGWLGRMTQFKEKAGKRRDESSVGLFTYPALMAADILAYRATLVPIGEDQKQHLELARDIAQKFNNDVGKEFFPLPEPLIPKVSARVMSLRDGKAKMSKSDLSAMSRIELTDKPDEIAKKIQKAKTDTELLPDKLSDLAARPEANNLIGLIAALSNQTPEAVLTSVAGNSFKQVKERLSELLIATICPIGEKIEALYQDKSFLANQLEEGATRAQAIAEKNLTEIRALLGLC